MFQKLTGDVQGPLEVKGALEIEGTLHGGAIVTGTLDLRGTCLGPLEVRLDGHADVEGIIRGDVHARGGKLRLRGVVDGRLGVKPGADVQFAVGSVLNGRQLGEDGSFTVVEKAGKYSIPDDATMMRPEEDGTWVRAN